MEALEDVLSHSERLRLENELITNFLDRHKYQEGDSVQKVHKPPSEEQVLEVVKLEIEALTTEAKDMEDEKDDEIDQMRSEMEEIDTEMTEIKKDAYEFKRDIVVGAENFRTGKTIGEKVVRYMEDKIKAKTTAIDKLQQKFTNLRSQISKLEVQLQHKEDMGDVFHVIDYDQLKIENQQYLEKIEERNNELLRLKLRTGNTIQILNNMKQRLQTLTAESDWLLKETKARKDMLAKVLEEIARAEREYEDAKRIEKELAQDANGQALNMPQVLDYVQQKADMYELERLEKMYKKKLEISRNELKKCRQQRIRESK